MLRNSDLAVPGSGGPVSNRDQYWEVWKERTWYLKTQPRGNRPLKATTRTGENMVFENSASWEPAVESDDPYRREHGI
jgi:hypothetical protein